ncbi:MAG: hypothetical protein HOW97_30155 [Catenulispora sp.]|nr:hypothetical protein [Catenulispora sp.]
MNDTLSKFIGLYLRYELADDYIGNDRTAKAFDDANDGALKAGFEHLLATRELTREAYLELTDVEFPTEDALYEYLQAAYSYMYEGSGTWPALPADI